MKFAGPSKSERKRNSWLNCSVSFELSNFAARNEVSTPLTTPESKSPSSSKVKFASVTPVSEVTVPKSKSQLSTAEKRRISRVLPA